MQEGRVLPARQINADLLRSVLASPKWFWVAVGVLAIFVLDAFSTAGFMFNHDFGRLPG